MSYCKDNCKHWKEVKGTNRCWRAPWNCPGFEEKAEDRKMDCCDESKETRFCKDCKHWAPTARDKGTCGKLDAESHAIVRAPSNFSGNADTWELFGCVFFEPKLQGPFVIHQDEKGFYLTYRPTCNSLIHWDRKASALRMCNTLNEAWERRE